MAQTDKNVGNIKKIRKKSNMREMQRIRKKKKKEGGAVNVFRHELCYPWIIEFLLFNLSAGWLINNPSTFQEACQGR